MFREPTVFRSRVWLRLRVRTHARHALLCCAAEDTSGSQHSSGATSATGAGGAGSGGGRGGAAGDGPPSSLDLSLRWEGMVLKDVELRRDFLSELLGLPVDVPHAFIRRAVLHLPWYTLLLG